jgi:hypothetical protein
LEVIEIPEKINVADNEPVGNIWNEPIDFEMKEGFRIGVAGLI